MQTGFARSASEAMFPRLFPDAGWWCPSLNPAMGGTRLWDLSRGQNWGTLTNMANDDWVVNGGKGALDFDGSDDRVVVPDSGALNPTQGISVSAWFRVASTTAGVQQAIVRKGWSAGTNLQYSLRVLGDKLSAFCVNTTGTLAVATGDTSLAVNKWHFGVLTYDRSNVQVYLDGLRDATTALTGNLAVFSQPLQIAAGFDTTLSQPTLFLGGQLDDIRIFRTALTASDARQLWQIGRGNMPLRRRRRYTEQAGGFKGYWTNRQHLIGSGVY